MILHWEFYKITITYFINIIKINLDFRKWIRWTQLYENYLINKEDAFFILEAPLKLQVFIIEKNVILCNWFEYSDYCPATFNQIVDEQDYWKIIFIEYSESYILHSTGSIIYGT